MTGEFSFGLIGEHIGYSRSPAIFEAIFSLERVKGSFELYEIDEANFAPEFERVIQTGVRGLAVTIPHKERVMPFLHDLDPVAEAVGAVNAIATDGRLQGFNTDVSGFARALAPYREAVAGRPALILGGGGAARAAVVALHGNFDVSSFVMVSRRIETLRKAAQHLLRYLSDFEIVPLLPDQMPTSAHDLGIVVNATPLGGWNFPDQSPLPKEFDWNRVGVYNDLNYNHENPIVGRAREAGVTALDGSAMLVAQALESFRRWTGRTVPFEPVYAAAFPERLR